MLTNYYSSIIGIIYLRCLSAFSKCLPLSKSWSVLPKFSCSSFTVLGLICIWEFLIHLEWIFEQAERYMQVFILHVDTFSLEHLLKRLPFLLCFTFFFLHFSWILDCCNHVCLLLCPLLCLLGPWICFCLSSVMVSILWLYIVLWEHYCVTSSIDTFT